MGTRIVTWFWWPFVELKMWAGTICWLQASFVLFFLSLQKPNLLNGVRPCSDRFWCHLGIFLERCSSLMKGELLSHPKHVSSSPPHHLPAFGEALWKFTTSVATATLRQSGKDWKEVNPESWNHPFLSMLLLIRYYITCTRKHLNWCTSILDRKQKNTLLGSAQEFLEDSSHSPSPWWGQWRNRMSLPVLKSPHCPITVQEMQHTFR